MLKRETKLYTYCMTPTTHAKYWYKLNIFLRQKPFEYREKNTINLVTWVDLNIALKKAAAFEWYIFRIMLLTKEGNNQYYK